MFPDLLDLDFNLEKENDTDLTMFYGPFYLKNGNW